MHLRSLKKTRKDVSLHDPIGTDNDKIRCYIIKRNQMEEIPFGFLLYTDFTLVECLILMVLKQ